MRAASIIAALGLLAGLLTAIGGCGGPDPVAGTWGVAPQLDRKLDRRLEKRRVTGPVLQRRLARARARRDRLGDRLAEAKVQARAARELSSRTVGCEPDVGAKLFVDALHVATLGVTAIAGLDARDLAGRCLRPDAVELIRQAGRYADRARTLAARRARARRAVRAALRRVRREAALAERTRAKARAARLITAQDVRCSVRDGRVRVQLTVSNDYAAGVDALVMAAYVTRGPDGRRDTAAPPKNTLVTLDRGDRRDLDIDAGPSPAGGLEAILACAPRLADVRLRG